MQAHIFVSWLHPVKEQRLVVVGSEKMAVFDDTAEHKLVLYPAQGRMEEPHADRGEGRGGSRSTLDGPRAAAGGVPAFPRLRRVPDAPVSDGAEGLRVLRVLDACQRSLQNGGIALDAAATRAEQRRAPYFVHESAYVDEGAEIGDGTKIWHFSHVMKGARIGERCVIGQNVNVDGGDRHREQRQDPEQRLGLHGRGDRGRRVSGTFVCL